MGRISVSSECIGCGACVSDCTRRAISIDNGSAVFYEDACNDCFHCVAVCPVDAISISGYDKTEIIAVREYSISPDDFLDFQKSRRSIRQFRKTSIDQDILEKIIESGRYSPTGGNLQSNRFIVCKESVSVIRNKVIDTLYGLAMNDSELERLNLTKYKNIWINMYNVYKDKGEDRLFFDAPCLIIITSCDVTGNGQVNGGIAASRMELLANAFGLGVCYIGFLKRALSVDPNIRKLIEMKDDEEYVAAFVTGYPEVKYLRTVCKKTANVRYI